MGNVVVDLSEVSFFYDETPVLKNVTLTVPKNSLTGLIGPNGGGKTTFLRLLMGFLKPTQGRVRIFGKSCRKARCDIAYVPQNLVYDRSFPITVLQVVLSGCLYETRWWGPYRASDKQRALEQLDRVGLSSIATRPFGSLSGGQAQRVLLARALISNPKLLLLDEPTSNMDLATEAGILDLFTELKKEMTIMMVTHDLKTIIERVDHILCVQTDVLPLLPDKVCEHFALGLYHRPLMEGKEP
jgi:zinc transport system ATP-binding protein